jgi:hypothetical protein
MINEDFLTDDFIFKLRIILLIIAIVTSSYLYFVHLL